MSTTEWKMNDGSNGGTWDYDTTWGQRLKVDKSFTVTEIGAYFHNPLSNIKFSIWDATTSNLVVSATGSAVGSSFSWVSVANTTLEVNREYFMTIYHNSTDLNIGSSYVPGTWGRWESQTIGGITFSHLYGYWYGYGDKTPNNDDGSSTTLALGLRGQGAGGGGGTTPQVTIVSIDKLKISDESGMDISTVVFKFDVNIQSWVVRVLGADHTTGTLADFGGSLSAGTETFALIDHTELPNEGANRVNIYGQSTDGTWTPFG